MHLECDFIFLIHEIQKNYTPLHYRINDDSFFFFSIQCLQNLKRIKHITKGGQSTEEMMKDHSNTSKKEVDQAFYLNVLSAFLSGSGI